MANVQDEVILLNIKISNLTSEELNLKILEAVQNNRKFIFSHVNIHAFNFAFKSKFFLDFLNTASVNFCDGDGVRLGANFLGMNIKQKITYNRWIWELGGFSVKNNLSWYIIGCKPDVIAKARDNLKDKLPDLNVVGTHHGYLSESEINKVVIEDIKEKKPNILIAGMGMPIQEKWLSNNFDELDFNVALTAGAAFEYVAGTAKMTPDIFYKLKLEWFYRFLQEPRRLFKRYFIGNFVFFFRIFREKIRLLLHRH